LSAKIQATGFALQEYQAAVDDFDREMARILGVNGTDLRCLEILIGDSDAEVTPRMIADRLALTTGSVTTMLDRLERAGLIARTPHATDRRKTVVEITPEARARAWAMLAPLLEDGAADIAARFSADELEVVQRFIVRATEHQRRHVARLRGQGSSGGDR